MSRTIEDLIGALEPPTVPERPTPDPTTFLRENARRRAARTTRKKTLAVVGATLSVVIVVAVPVALTHSSHGQVATADPTCGTSVSQSSAPAQSSAPVGSLALAASRHLAAAPPPPPIDPCFSPEPTGPDSSDSSAPTSPARLVYQRTLRDTTASDGYEISPWYVDVTYQEARVLPPVGGVGKPQGSVHVYERGYYDASLVRGTGTAVLVAGTTGFYVDSGPVPTNRFDPDPTVQEPLLAWEYASGAWALVSGFTEDEAITVAAAVQIGPAEAVRLPFTLSYVPSRLGTVDAFTLGQAGGLSAAAWYAGGPFVSAHEPLSFADLGLAANYTIDGHPAALTANSFEITFDDFGLTVYTTNQAEAEQVVAGMTFADWNDPSTYLAVSP